MFLNLYMSVQKYLGLVNETF